MPERPFPFILPMATNEGFASPLIKQMQSEQNSALPGLLNISNMRLVIMNPPVMLILDTSVASAANEVAVLLGSTPPPIKTNPPAALMPEIALVRDIRGE